MKPKKKKKKKNEEEGYLELDYNIYLFIARLYFTSYVKKHGF